ncbi:hypothetical protein BH10PSE12_BH10PSE12_13400 [soil metagenome]
MPTAADVLRAYCAEMEKGADGCIALMAPDIVIYTPCIPAPIPKSIHGRDAVAATFQALFGQLFGTFRWASLEVHGTDDPEVAVALAKSQVVLKDGRDYANDYMFWSRVRDGKIVEQHEYMDGERAGAAMQGMF